MNVWMLALSLFAPAFTLEGHELVLPGPVVYEMAGAALKPESEPALAHVKSYLDEKAYISSLRIEVHTDTDGNPEANQKLSEARALAVAKWLVGKGVACKRLIPVGFGAMKPVAPNDTPDGKAQNRRTEFHNAALRDRPIGGMPLDGGGKVAGDPCQ